MLNREQIKNLQQNQKIHHQKDTIDPSAGSIGTLGADVVEPIAVLALTKLAFNRNALQVYVVSPYGTTGTKF
jgi:hypothetical protein